MNLYKIQSNYAIAFLLTTIVPFSCIVGLMFLIFKSKLVLFTILYMTLLAFLMVYVLVLWYRIIYRYCTVSDKTITLFEGSKKQDVNLSDIRCVTIGFNVVIYLVDGSRWVLYCCSIHKEVMQELLKIDKLVLLNNINYDLRYKKLHTLSVFLIIIFGGMMTLINNTFVGQISLIAIFVILVSLLLLGFINFLKS